MTQVLNRQQAIGIRRQPPRRSAGFTLIEAALATVIVGTGVLAIVSAQQAYHKKNDWAQRSSTGFFLANELREMTLTLPMHDPLTADTTVGPEANEDNVRAFDDLDDFAGVVSAGKGAGLAFNPPINALRQQIDGLPGWQQTIVVDSILADNISSTFVQPLGTTDLMRATVTVTYQPPGAQQATTINRLVWVVGED